MCMRVIVIIISESNNKEYSHVKEYVYCNISEWMHTKLDVKVNKLRKPV